MDYKRKEYNLILKPWITKEKSITLFLTVLFFLNTFYKRKRLVILHPYSNNTMDYKRKEYMIAIPYSKQVYSMDYKRKEYNLGLEVIYVITKEKSITLF